jgi:hypothetical protein
MSLLLLTVTALATQVPGLASASAPHPSAATATTAAAATTPESTHAVAPRTDVLGPCDDDIDFGERVSCTFNQPSTVHELDFPANAGDQILVRVVVTGGSVNPLTSVLLGASTVCNGGFGDQFTCAIVSNGRHTVKIDANGSGTGTVAATIQRLNDPTGCVNLAYGTEGKAGKISASVEVDCYSHTASANQRWWVHVVETGGTANLLQQVVRPDGTVVCSFSGATDMTCLLDQSGPFRVLVEDSGGLATGDYRIVVEKFPGPTGCADADLGKRVGVEVSKPGALACVTVKGSGGDQLRIRDVVSSGSWNPLVDVVRPDGSTVCQGGFADEFTCALTTNGVHTVVLRDGTGTGSATGAAGVFLQIVNDPAGCTSLPYGTAGKTGKISPAVEIDCFSHDAKAGERWRVRVVETGGTANLLQEVVRPDGTVVCSLTGATDNTCLLDQDGPTRVFVQDSAGTATGDYRVVLERFPNPTGCTAAELGKRVAVAVSKAGAIDCVTFTGKAGDFIRIRDVVTSGSWTPLSDVVRPDGSIVCQAGFADEFTCQLTTNGKHTLVLADGTGTGAAIGEADVIVQNLTHPEGCVTIKAGTTGKSGAISPAVQIDCFEFAGKAGERWLVHVVETGGTANLVQEVVGPDGSVVCSLSGATDQICLLTSNGPSRVLVQDSGGLATGDYRIVVQRFPKPAGCDKATIGGAVVNGSIEDPGAIGCATFTAKAGKTFHVKVVGADGLNPLTDVLRTDGSIVCQGGFGDDFVCTPTTNGTHTVYVREGSGTGSATGTYTIELDEG